MSDTNGAQVGQEKNSKKKSNRQKAALESAVEESLHHRPNVEALAQRGIVPPTHVAPALSAAAKALARNMLTDTLNHKLQARENLTDVSTARLESLLPASNVAPRLRQTKVRLEQAITRDQLGRLLECRPDVEELEHSNILSDVRIAPSLQSIQRQLAHNLAKANLYHALKHRPSIDKMHEMGYLPNDAYAEATAAEHELHPSVAPQYVERVPLHSQQQTHQSGEEKHEAQPTQQAGYQQPMAYQRRSKNFHLTRILLKAVASMAEAGDISLQQKGLLKDLIVDQDSTILSIAEAFDTENDLNEFKEALYRLATSQRP